MLQKDGADDEVPESLPGTDIRERQGASNGFALKEWSSNMQHSTVRYALTIAAVVLAAVARWLLDPLLGDNIPYATFFAAVAFAAWLGGIRTGLLATGLGVFLALFLFVPPRLSFLVTTGPHMVGLAMYVVVGIMIAVFGEALRISQRRSVDAEKHARQQAETLRITISSIGDAVISTDANGYVTYLNAVAEAMTGWNKADAIGKPLEVVFKIINEQTRQPVENPVEKVLKLGQVVGLANHTILVAKDGTERPIDDSAAPIRDDQGQILGVILVFHDITERRRAEASKRETEREVVATLESITDGFMRFDREWRVAHMNAEAERIVQRRRDEVLGKSLWELWPATVGTKLEAEYRRAVIEQVTIELENFYEPWNKWFAVKCYPTPDGGLTVFFQDITERKQAEEQITRQKQQMKFVLSATGVGTWLNEYPLGDLNWDEQTRALFFVRPGEKPTIELFWSRLHPDDQEPTRLAVESAVRDRRLYEIDHRIIHPETGEVRWIRSAGRATYGPDGTPIRFDGINYDITARKRTEEDLALSFGRERLRAKELEAVMAAVPAVVWIAHDPDCHRITGNPASYEMLRLPPDVNQSLSAPEAERPKHFKIVKDGVEVPPDQLPVQLAAGGVEVRDLEEEVAFEDGTCIHLFGHAMPLRDDEGRVRGSVAAFVDITARKRAEAELRQTTQQLRIVTESMAAPVTQCSRDLKYLWVSKHYADWIGRSPEEIASRPIVDIIGNKAFEQLRPHFERVLAGEVVRYEEQIDFQGIGPRWINAVYTPTLDHSGTPDGWVAVVIDIHDRKRIENTLREQAALLDLAHDAIIVRSTKGVIAFWSHGAEQMYGWPKEAVMGQVTHTLLQTEFPEPLPEIETVLSQRGWWEGSLVHTRQDGKKIIVASRWALQPSESVHPGIILEINQDITERRRVEEALRDADRRKDEFLATLAHELRNPLAPIRNGLQLMRMSGKDEHAVEQARAMMDRQLNQMVRLVDDLMDVSRISRGKLELKKEWVQLAIVINSAVETSRPIIEQMGHAITVTIPKNPIIVNADLTRLAQVFVNLLNNAAKYSERGGRIWLTAERQGSDVVVTVKDTGIGIAADQLLHIFEMFSQVDRSIERSQSGLGIGLTLVRRLVEMHDGSIEAKSEGAGKGSEFVVRLPVVVEASVPQEADNSHDDDLKSTLRILVVDDNKDSADSLSMMLKIMGNDTQTAYDGEEAVLSAEKYKPDVILLDIGLPKLNGYEACRRIREMPWGKKLVIIAQTGWGQDGDRQRTHDAGFDHHMVKPVDPTTLMKMLAGLSDAARK